MPSPPSKRRLDRRRLRNRAALLEAALALFQHQGLRATKLEEICARADVAPRTFFNHFETREHLVRAIAAQRAQQLAARLEADDPAERFAERLTRMLEETGRYLAARPPYRELVGEMLRLHPESGSEMARGQTLGRACLRFVEAGVARGEVTRTHPPAVLADLLIGTLVTALTNWCADERYDLETGLAEARLALLDLLSPRPHESAEPPDPEIP